MTSENKRRKGANAYLVGDGLRGKRHEKVRHRGSLFFTGADRRSTVPKHLREQLGARHTPEVDPQGDFEAAFDAEL